MPVGQALCAAAEGAAFGFFPILWIVINAVWVYNLTVASGHFDVLRRSFEKVSPDQRIQAIIIAFCFGALLEALAGFGTPVAITVVMLMSLGFSRSRPRRSRWSRTPRRSPSARWPSRSSPWPPSPPASATTRGSRRHVWTRSGRWSGGRPDPGPVRAAHAGVRRRRPARRARDLAAGDVAGSAFGVAQFVAANFISVPLADIVASLVAAASVVLLLRVWQPAEVLTAEIAEREETEHATTRPP